MPCLPKQTNNKMPCPQCGEISESVEEETMLHQLRYPHNMQIEEDISFFCHSPQCSVGYFNNNKVFPLQDLREEKKIKQNHLCYCFDISETTYKEAIEAGTASDVKSFIISLTKKKLCACNVRNPSGRCCLAAFKELEQKA